MMEPIPKNIEKIESCLERLSTGFNDREDLERLHRNNEFNRRGAAALSSFSDLKATAVRLDKNIGEVEILERKIQKRNEVEDKFEIQNEGQKLRAEQQHINQQNQADFRSLYLLAKIFLDDYTRLLRFIFNWRHIGDSSVTDFYNSLEKYPESELQVLSFKEHCFDKLKSVDVFITQYRDDYVAHNQKKHKETTWFLNDMQGGVRFIGGRPSITPLELMYIVNNYISSTVSFIETEILSKK